MMIILVQKIQCCSDDINRKVKSIKILHLDFLFMCQQMFFLFLLQATYINGNASNQVTITLFGTGMKLSPGINCYPAWLNMRIALVRSINKGEQNIINVLLWELQEKNGINKNQTFREKGKHSEKIQF